MLYVEVQKQTFKKCKPFYGHNPVIRSIINKYCKLHVGLRSLSTLRLFMIECEFSSPSIVVFYSWRCDNKMDNLTWYFNLSNS